jgi:hypothetical protein
MATRPQAGQAHPGASRTRGVEEMLGVLGVHDVRLAPGRTIDDLLSEWSREQIEGDGYEMLLVALGGERLHPETLETIGVLSHDVWHFDPESMDGPGAYAALVRRVVLLSHGDLALEPVSDHVDWEAGEAWVEWTIDGRPERHDLQIHYDLIDMRLFGQLDRLLAAAGSARRLWAARLGEDALILCCDAARRDALASLAGLTFGKPA